jgi:hypothetical protein
MENPESQHIEVKDVDIDKQVKAVYDELKSYIDSLVCCGPIYRNVLIRESRLEYAMSKLKFLVWQKLHNVYKS